MRFLLLMLATLGGTVACQKDQPLSRGNNAAATSAAPKSAGAPGTRTGAAPIAEDDSDGEPPDDDVVPATDKSGVDNAGSEADDSNEPDTEAEE